MKFRLLLVLILILILVAPTLALFHAPPPSVYQTTASGGSSVVVIAREDYVYARVVVTIQPDGLNQTAAITFPNGTAVTITNKWTETIVLPNTIYFSPENNGIDGPGYHVYGSQPLDVEFLSGQNATNFLGPSQPSQVPVKGIDVYYIAIDGQAMVTTQVLGVSL